MFQYEQIVNQISGNGKYQAILVVIALSPYMHAAYLNTGSVFLAGLPESYCSIDEFDNKTHRLNDSIKKLVIPLNHNTKSFDRCTQYNLTACDDNKTMSCYEANSRNGQVISCRNGYYFDRETAYEETVTTEWNLVCDRLSLSSASTSFYYLGMFIGSIVGGMLSDRFGRATIYRISAILTVLCSIAVAFSPNIYVFALLRMLSAAVYLPGVISGFVYANETTKSTWRTAFGSLANCLFGAGCIVLSAMAFEWRRWQALSIAIAVAILPMIVFSIFMTKSPRWLLSKGRKEEAKEVCKVMAKRNDAEFPDQLFEDLCFYQPTKKTKSEKRKHFGITELFIRPCTRYLLICNGFVWAVTSLVYYGLILNSGKLAGNVYINHGIGGVVEIVACLFSIPVIARIGRKDTTVWSFVISSLSCLGSTCVANFGAGNQVVRIQATILSSGLPSGSYTF